PRRSTAPFSPAAAASYSATTSSLYCAVNVRRRAFSGTSGSGRSCRSPVTCPASPATRPRSSTVTVIWGIVSIPALGESVVTGGRVPHDSLAERAGRPVAAHLAQSSACHLGNGIKHVVDLTFDNVHFFRDNPNVPSDLQMMPNLLNFFTSNGTLMSNNHTPLIAHTANDLLTTA